MPNHRRGKDLCGALFRVREQKSEQHPTHRGEVFIDGVKYRLSAWVKTAKSGEKYFSLALSKEQHAEAAT
jgi:hypothetical protein